MSSNIKKIFKNNSLSRTIKINEKWLEVDGNLRYEFNTWHHWNWNIFNKLVKTLGTKYHRCPNKRNLFKWLKKLSSLIHVIRKLGYQCSFVAACNDGTFGIDCLNNCSGQCLHGAPCNKQTGLCDRGCNPGYTNIFCNESK